MLSRAARCRVSWPLSRPGTLPLRASLAGPAPPLFSRPLSSLLSSVKLTEAQRNVVAREQNLLRSLQDVTKGMVGPEDDVIAACLSDSQLAPFLLTVVGEFNAGKSTLINALLGGDHLKTGVTPTTADVSIITGDPNVALEGTTTVAVDVDWLDDVAIVDTPGTNAIVEGHEQLTKTFLPRADLILIVTSSDRPFSASEADFLSGILHWQTHEKLAFVVNKMDAVPEQSRAEILKFVADNAKQMIGADPPVFPVAARPALTGQGDAVDFHAFQRFVVEKLTASERVKMKLETPLSVADGVLRSAVPQFEAAGKTLSADRAIIAAVDDRMSGFAESVVEDFDMQFARIDRVLMDVEREAMLFLDQHLRLSNLPSLLRPTGLADQFESRVFQSLPGQLEEAVGAIVDWMVTKGAEEQAAAMEMVALSASRATSNSSGSAPNAAFLNRRALQLEARGSIIDALSIYRHDLTAKDVASAVQSSSVQTMVLEAGAIGATGVVALASLDWSGLIGAGALAAAGLAVLPAKKQSLKTQVSARLDDLRVSLRRTLAFKIDGLVTDVKMDVHNRTSAYRGFVSKEWEAHIVRTEKLDAISTELKALRKELSRM